MYTCRCAYYNNQPISAGGLALTIPIAFAFIWFAELKKSTWYILCKEQKREGTHMIHCVRELVGRSYLAIQGINNYTRN